MKNTIITILFIWFSHNKQSLQTVIAGSLDSRARAEARHPAKPQSRGNSLSWSGACRATKERQQPQLVQSMQSHKGEATASIDQSHSHSLSTAGP